MTRKIISKQLWKSLQPLLPPQQPSPRGGRPRLDNYAVLNGILSVLITGLPWEDLHQLHQAGYIDWSRASLDGASVASPGGARKQDLTRQTEAGWAVNDT